MQYLGSQTEGKDISTVGKNLHPDSATAAMTQSVGVDGNGKLWTAPGLTQQISALLMSILNAGTYEPSQTSNLAALASLILTITIVQSGTTLYINGSPDVTSISKSGTTLSLS